MSEELIEQPVSREITDIPAHEAVIDAPIVEESSIDETPKISKYEADAIAKGWKPKDQFSGDLEEFRPAKEWLERGELLDTIHSLNRKVTEHQGMVEHLASVSKKVEEVTRSRVLAELEERHKHAVEIGDVNRASDMVKEMVKVHSEVSPAAPKSGLKEPPEISDFIARNSAAWFNDTTAENAAMKAFAVRRSAEIHASNPTISAKDEIALVESDVKRTFHHRFVSAPSAAVSAPTSAPSKPREVGVSNLPEFHQKMVKTLQRSIKDFDVKSYINNLKKAGEIK